MEGMHLNTETTVDLGNVIIILPYDAELENTLRDLNNVESLLVLGVCVQEGLERGGQLIKSL